MINSYLSTGTWASIDERCPLHCKVDGRDEVHVLIGGEDHGIQLLFAEAGMRTLAAACTRAVAELDALAALEKTEYAGDRSS